MIRGLPGPLGAAYRLLLCALPRRLRARHGRDMADLVAARVAALGPHASRSRRLRLVAREMLDLITTSARAHWAANPIPGRRDPMFANLLQDVRFSARTLARRPLFAAALIGILALGIGATTTVFTIYRSVLLRPLPYPEPHRLVYTHGANAANARVSISPLDFLDFRERNRTFEHFAALHSYESAADLTGAGEPVRLRLRGVSHDFFDALGLPMTAGRDFRPEEESESAAVVVLSPGAWQRLFGGDPGLTGATPTLDGETVRVIGVAPPVPTWFPEVDAYFPIPFDSEGAQTRRFHFLHSFGRLRDGVSLTQAASDLDAIAGELALAYPATNEGWGLNPIALPEYVSGHIAAPLNVLLAAVAALLLIAGSNVATIMLTRSTARATEIAVRSALGASSTRVARLVLTESLLLSAIGGLVGLALTLTAIPAIANAAGLPTATELRFDPVILVVVSGLVVGVALFVAVMPSLRLARRDSADLLRSARTDGARSARPRQLLIALQVALSTALLLGAALFLRSFWNLHGQDAGFRTERVTIAELSLPDARYSSSDEVLGFFDRLRERAAAIPAVESVGFVSKLPLTGGNDLYVTRPDLPADDPANGSSAQFRTVVGDYFGTLGIPLVAGRLLERGDGRDSDPVALIDRRLADILFAGDDPVGRTVRVHAGEPLDLRVVGLVGNVRHFGLSSDPAPSIYLPGAQLTLSSMSLVTRTTDAAPAVDALRSIVRDLDPLLPLSGVGALEDLLRGSTASERFRTILVGFFAVTALLLATIGLYGSMSYWVAERRGEVGVRIALGADRGSVLRLVLRRGLVSVFVGLAAGIVLGLAGGRLAANLLFGVSGSDPASLLAVVVTLAVAGHLACLLPARRASRLDPVDALRAE